MKIFLSNNIIRKTICLFCFLIFYTAYTQCPTSITYPSSANGVTATTAINGNSYRLGNSILTLSNTSIVSFTNTIEAGHQSALGIEIGHSGNADSFNNRVETTLSFSLPIYNLNFNLNDIDAGDRVRIQAYNQNNSLISLATGNFTSGSTITAGTSPNWEFTSGNSNVPSSDTNTSARIAVNLNGQYVSRIVLQYYDVNSNGSYTIANITGGSICAQNDVFGTVQLGMATAASVFANDLSSTGTTASSANTDVSLTNLGGLTGATINANGTINIPSNAAAGSYTLTYRICSPTGQTSYCTTATASLTVPACVAGTAQPILNNSGAFNNNSYSIPCGSTTANLSTITASNKPAPATVTLTWHTGTPAITANKITTVTALTGTTKYYASFFDSVANCYSPTREVLVTAPICAVNDDYSSTPIIAGVGGTLPTIYANDTYNGTLISTLPSGTVGFQFSIWTPSNATVNSNGTITIPPTTPPGVYTYSYQINDLDPDAPTTTSNFSVATVTFVVLADSDGDGIADVNDLDDDNDGIPDTVECPSVPNTVISEWRNATNTFPATVPAAFSTYLTASNSTAGSGLTRSFVSVQNYQLISNVAATSEATAIDNSEYVEYTITVNKPLGINQIRYYATSDDNTQYTYTLRVSSNGFASSSSVHGAAFYLANNTNTTITLPNTMYLSPGVTYTFRVYFYNVGGGTAATFGHDDFTLLGFAECDTDGDLIPNRLDLDSDDDGCFDAIEGGENVLASQLNTNGSINTTLAAPNNGVGSAVANLGVPNLVNTGGSADTGSSTAGTVGQLVGSSQVINPSAVAGTASANQTIASGTAPLALNLIGSTGTIQWQVSSDNVTFTDITTATSATYSPGILTATRYYRAIVTSAGGCTAISNYVAIGVINCTSGVDSDGDGVSDICDLDDDNDGILDTAECPSYVPSSEILIQSATNISYFNVQTNVKTPFCTGNLNATTDIAISPTGVMYGVYNTGASSSTLAIINSGNCSTTTLISNLGFTSNSLSFLPDGNLLVGSGSTSKIYKINLTTNTITEWHDYLTGNANGDFIFINGKIYVLWFSTSINSTNPVIREVTVDANYNYISETILGPVQRFAFGLAKANGNELYAVTAIGNDGGSNPPGTIIKINLNPFSWTVVSNNSEGLLGATSIEEGTKECDTDEDGIPNRLDLDSDGDNCFDAIEGGENVLASQLNTNGSINITLAAPNNGVGSAVTNLGVPNLVNTGGSADTGSATAGTVGQPVGQSQNAFQNDCLDTDGDGIPDWQDLDDDNDGILDTNEIDCSLQNADTRIIWSFNNGTFAPSYRVNSPTETYTIPTNYFSNGSNLSFGTGMQKYQIKTVDTNDFEVQNVNQFTLSAAKTDNDYIQVSYTPATAMSLSGLNLGFAVDQYTSGVGQFSASRKQLGEYKVAVEYSTSPSFGSPILLASNIQVPDLELVPQTSYYTLATNFSSSRILSAGTTYYFRIYLYDVQNGYTSPSNPSVTANSVLIDDIFLMHQALCADRDTDSDGTPDRLDLDSDGDNCFDAIEGGENVLASQLNTNGSINITLAAPNNGVGSAVANLGVPNLVNTGGSADTGSSTAGTVGQLVGSSQDALVSGCVCYEDPALVAGATYPVKHGITVLGRAGKVSTGTANTDTDWPMNRNSAYTALESKTKGFVVTRNSNPEGTIAIPVVGMMVFDTDENAGAGCLKIYTGSGAGEGWKCFNNQGCP